MNSKEFDQMVDGYLEAAEWADKPDGSHARFCKSAIERARLDCQRFVDDCGPLVDKAVNLMGYSAVRFGRDFWLNRCGHGVGFWDRKELEIDVGFNVTFLGRDGKTQAVNPTMELGYALSLIAYGDSGFISKYAYAELYAYRGWLYFC